MKERREKRVNGNEKKKEEKKKLGGDWGACGGTLYVSAFTEHERRVVYILTSHASPGTREGCECRRGLLMHFLEPL